MIEIMGTYQLETCKIEESSFVNTEPIKWHLSKNGIWP